MLVVVGPSGAGKDTLMAAARARLGGDARFRFVRRAITRPAKAGGEDHLPLDRPAFLARREADGFALWWEAHGLLYGIPADIVRDLEAGRVLVGNLSRTVLEEAHRRFPLLVLAVTAPPAVLATRLAARSREGEAAIAARLAREVPLPPMLEVAQVVNNGPLERGTARVLEVLREAAARRPAVSARAAPAGSCCAAGCA